MYTAKREQSGVELYDLSRDEHTTQRLALVGELRAAIADEQLEVHYQPQIDLATGRVLGAEALVRWTHPTRGFIPPDEFIPVAEQAGLIGPLTTFVLTRALAECKRWRRTAPDLRMSVNLSPRSLLQESLADDVSALLANAALPATALCLELTEGSVMLDPKRTIPNLNRLRAIGVTIALDDFGTGHSSLAYLKQLPVGEIKIDKSFVLGMTGDRFDEAIVCSIIDLARHLLVPVVAEGIEDLDVGERLRIAGCAFGQGYGYSRPLPPDRFSDWLATITATKQL
jgi:EAL domain-containing protein (putative c-di-GMP-specific phosphodiesterase class I)